MSYLMRGVLIGFIFGVPGGAIGALVMQRTFSYGKKAGLLTGLGSSFADCIHAGVGVFGITLISDFISQHQTIINILGGCLILFMGIRLLLGKTELVNEKLGTVESAKMVLSTFMIGLANPATIFVFLFAFSYLGVSKEADALQRTLVVCGAFFGTYIWWGIIAVVVPMIREKAVKFRERYMNKIFGTLLCLLGAVVFVRVLF